MRIPDTAAANAALATARSFAAAVATNQLLDALGCLATHTRIVSRHLRDERGSA
jgi:hypothetical protein